MEVESGKVQNISRVFYCQHLTAILLLGKYINSLLQFNRSRKRALGPNRIKQKHLFILSED